MRNYLKSINKNAIQSAPQALFSSSKTTTQPSKAHWDNACTYNIVNDTTMTYNIKKLSSPIYISGIGGKDMATHIGQLKALPSTPPGMNTALYGPNLSNNLFSLGQLQLFGGTYTTASDPNRIIIRRSPNGAILDTPKLDPSNLLLPVNFDNLRKSKLANPADYLTLNPSELTHPSQLLPTSALLSTEDTAAAPPPSSKPPTTPPGLTPNSIRSTYTREQIARSSIANELHYERLHPSDAQLVIDLNTGKIPHSRVTPADLALYRKLNGPCLDCIQGKTTVPSRPTSQSAPASKPGQVLSYDPQPLTTTVLGGYTVKHAIVDEHSKHLSMTGSINKQAPIVFAALMKQIRQTFNAHRHRVEKLMADPEALNKALQASLGAVGINTQYAYPGEHATRIERGTRTVQEHGRTVVAGLAFHLPAELQLLLDQAVCEALNNSVNKDTYPLTPNQVVSGFLPKNTIVEFGRSALVLQHDDKRSDISKSDNIPLKQVPKSEIGVSMGPIPGTDQTRWLLANGKVVPRRQIGPLLPRSFVPFGWKAKPRIVISTLPTPSPEELLTPYPPTTTNPHHHEEPNSNIQTPDADNTIALSIPKQTPTTTTTHPQQTTLPPPTLASPQAPTTTTVPQPLSTAAAAPTPTAAPQPAPHTATSSPAPAPPNTPSTMTAPPTNTPRAPEQPSTPSHVAAPKQQMFIAAPKQQMFTPPPSPRTTAPAAAAPPAPTQQMFTPRAPPPAPPPSPRATAPAAVAPPTPSIQRAAAQAPAPVATRSSSRTTHIPGQFAILNSRGRPGTYLAYALVSKAHLDRKLAASRTASQRERDHMRLHPPPKELNNHLTNILPTPPTRQQNEFSLKNALMCLPPPQVIAAVGKELHKIFIKFGAMKLIDIANIEKNAVYLKSLLIIREKTNKDITARLAINGAGQPPSSYGATHAGTSDPAHRIFILATALADAALRDKKLVTASFDIEGAFINNNPLPRSMTGGHQLLVRLPNELPRPYGGALAEITGTMYGLKQSNHIYDQNLIKTLADAGYFPCPSHPYTFIKLCPENPQDYLIVSFHVDDGDLVCTSNHLLPEFKDIITKRYGVTKFYEPSQGICGMRQTTNPDKSVTLDFGPYIEKMLHRIGMDKVPPALSPSRAGLFTLPTSAADLKPLSPEAAANFSRINGELIFILPLRHDCRKEIVHLCRSLPIVDNFAKQFHLLRYLKHTANLGLTFSANKADFPNGVEISSASDAAQNVHPADSRSHSAYTLTVGPPHAKTAPFLAYSKAETSCIPLSPLESEYVAMSRSAKPLMHFRDFHTDLGFAPTGPSKMLADNQSAIKLVQASLVPSKSRHIRLPFHHIRDLHKTGQIQPVHQGGTDIVPDIMTKDTGPSRFLFFRNKLHGIR